MVTFFMAHLNVEIKAKCRHPEAIRHYLHSKNASFAGLDIQTDTYFNVKQGRLKLREGNIENHLIYYSRDDQPGPKDSLFSLLKVPDPTGLKDMLQKSCGVLMIVKKQREIYYIHNVKFHIDKVDGLGSFIEIEAGNLLAEKTKDELYQQCRYYMEQMGVHDSDLVAFSYSDMMGNPELAI